MQDQQVILVLDAKVLEGFAQINALTAGACIKRRMTTLYGAAYYSETCITILHCLSLYPTRHKLPYSTLAAHTK